MLLSIAYAALALALVLVIASASAVHIERKRLLALADAAALDAADAIDLDRFYGETDLDSVPGGAVPLSDEGVRRAVDVHLDSSPAARSLYGLGIGEPTGVIDGTTARVTLVARARPPVVPWVLVAWSDGVPLVVTSTARAS